MSAVFDFPFLSTISSSPLLSGVGRVVKRNSHKSHKTHDGKTGVWREINKCLEKSNFYCLPPFPFFLF